MNHPCNHYSCCENHHGECFGGGCRLNPMPAPTEPNPATEEEGGNDPTL